MLTTSCTSQWEILCNRVYQNIPSIASLKIQENSEFVEFTLCSGCGQGYCLLDWNLLFAVVDYAFGEVSPAALRQAPSVPSYYTHL